MIILHCFNPKPTWIIVWFDEVDRGCYNFYVSRPVWWAARPVDQKIREPGIMEMYNRLHYILYFFSNFLSPDKINHFNFTIYSSISYQLSSMNTNTNETVSSEGSDITATFMTRASTNHPCAIFDVVCNSEKKSSNSCIQCANSNAANRYSSSQSLALSIVMTQTPSSTWCFGPASSKSRTVSPIWN